MNNQQYVLSQEEMLGLFWMRLAGADDGISIGFGTAYPYILKFDEEAALTPEEEREKNEREKYRSKYPLFQFCQEAGLALSPHTGCVSCKNWETFKGWMNDYLEAYQQERLLPNGEYLRPANSMQETKKILEQYISLFGKHFVLKKDCSVMTQSLHIPRHIRIFEDLLLLNASGIISIEVGDLAGEVERYEWPEIHVHILQPILTSLTEAISFLGITVTKENEVYFEGREIPLGTNTNEFKLLKILVEAKGQPLSVHDIYQKLDYKNKRKAYGYDSPKKSAPSPNKVKNDRLRSTIKRLLQKLGTHHLKIEAAEKTGVFLKTAD